jgi:uncharacterized membrane protein (DUF2068 family)
LVAVEAALGAVVADFAAAVAGLAAGAVGVAGVWALAATVLAANNKIKAVYFMTLSDSIYFSTEVYQVIPGPGHLIPAKKTGLLIRQLNTVWVPHPFPRFLRDWVGKNVTLCLQDQ